MKKKFLTLFLIFLFISSMFLFLAPASIFAPPSNIYVNAATGNDSWDGSSPLYISGDIGPKKTIGNAITLMAAYGTINIAAGTYHENLIIITNPGETLNLIGSGANKTIIDSSGSGNVFYITGNGSVVLKDVTITNGKSSVGAGISNGSPSSSGASLEIYNCIISNNQAFFPSPGQGGGIYNSNATLDIYDSQITNNVAVAIGGGIYNSHGLVTIHNSCISGNSAPICSGIYDLIPNLTINAQNNYWGSSSGPGGGIADLGNPTIFANGSGDEVFGDVYFYPWLASDPFASAASTVEATVEEPVWVRTMPMTCYRVWINEDNKFQFIFWYPYRDNNWVKIYDIGGKLVYEIDMPYDNPNLIVDLPNGIMYTVKTFTAGSTEPIQTFVIGK